MKTTLRILGVFGFVALFAVLMSSCGGKSDTPQTNLTLSAADTTGLAEFQAWKTQQTIQAMQPVAPQPVVYVTQPAPVQKTIVRKTASTQASAPATTAKKKGWSKSAKGAVIGAAVGAAAGAIINKRNRVVGGVIGGVLGGGAGYGIGRGMDKKDGRF